MLAVLLAYGQLIPASSHAGSPDLASSHIKPVRSSMSPSIGMRAPAAVSLESWKWLCLTAIASSTCGSLFVLEHISTTHHCASLRTLRTVHVRMAFGHFFFSWLKHRKANHHKVRYECQETLMPVHVQTTSRRHLPCGSIAPGNSSSTRGVRRSRNYS